ncbi:MAG TPA: preprotein translocase subunit SecE [Actinomycetota bacterium]|nr:preprotein translocase subunit SecE [Actinomycetota bacterium]
MNREYKRALKKQENQKRSAPRPVAKPTGAPVKKERTKPRDFLKEVIAELKKVAWPSRQEVVAYSVVVLVSVVVIATLIFGMDYVFSKAILALYGVDA